MRPVLSQPSYSRYRLLRLGQGRQGEFRLHLFLEYLA